MADEDIASKFEEYRAQASSRCVAAGCGALESCMGSSVCPSVAPAPVIGVANAVSQRKVGRHGQSLKAK